jgi:GGDEF domain-containing protein
MSLRDLPMLSCGSEWPRAPGPAPRRGADASCAGAPEDPARIEELFLELPARHLNAARLWHRIAAARERHEPLAVLFIDLRDATPSHRPGEAMICDTLRMIAATRIRTCLGPADLLSLFEDGGFVLLLADVRDPARIAQRLAAIRARVRETIELAGRRFELEAELSRSFRPLDVAHFERLAQRHATARVDAARHASLHGMRHATGRVRVGHGGSIEARPAVAASADPRVDPGAAVSAAP